ncbi:MAG: Fic family protein [Saprospiraceae bacterium]|nr:Fic family protein [Saprospiraceae bacterium]
MAKSKKDIGKLILEYIRQQPRSSSRMIYDGLGHEVGYATVKREIQALLAANLISAVGQGKATRYEISKAYQLLYPLDLDTYFEKEIDEREIHEQFNHSLIRDILAFTSLFTQTEYEYLATLQQTFSKNISALSETEFKKEFERLAIDLSWKSSQIEGNTYSLLETEKLLKDKETAAGKTKEEAIMLLNHKEALDFILEHTGYTQPLTTAGIEDIHSLLIKDLGVTRNIRNRRVGITGTNYRPLDNEFQIKEAIHDMCDIVNDRENVFEKALLVLVLISYIQPFADGNKRTARIISNAILMDHRYCPISFRTVDSIDYKKAMLVFYEQNNISAFKKIFVEQFAFAVGTYF